MKPESFFGRGGSSLCPLGHDINQKRGVPGLSLNLQACHVLVKYCVIGTHQQNSFVDTVEGCGDSVVCCSEPVIDS